MADFEVVPVGTRNLLDQVVDEANIGGGVVYESLVEALRKLGYGHKAYKEPGAPHYTMPGWAKTI